MKSAAVSFAALSISRSRNAARNRRPPVSQAASYSAWRSSRRGVDGRAVLDLSGMAVDGGVHHGRISAAFSLT